MTALYPGSFDPITYGHIDLVRRATKIFDKVVVAIAVNIGKEPLFTVEERVQLAKEAFKDLHDKVEVVWFEGLVVEFAKRHGIRILLRGLRMVSDFDYEFQMAITNRMFAPEIETLFLMPSEDYFYISSRLIKEIVALGGSVNRFVPDFVEKAMKEKLLTQKQDR